MFELVLGEGNDEMCLGFVVVGFFFLSFFFFPL